MRLFQFYRCPIQNLPSGTPFLGLLQLADWLGSDSAPDAFPFSEIGDASRFAFAHQRSQILLTQIGFDVAKVRASLPNSLDFNAVSSHVPSDIQRAAADAPGPIVVLEAETGSGKTEAALWRFATLFATGQVDRLYFALPTRVAASQIHGRVQRAMR
jgi:CRISPR-associated endonuclease/helicase Cas3